jgi:hypothetical protein
MKKVLALLIMVAWLPSACTFDVELLTPAPVELTSVPVMQSVTSPTSTVAETPEPPSIAPTSGTPLFFGAFFVADPLNDPSSRSAFPVGTKQIFAVWNYQNMYEGLMIKREWNLDGRPWLTRQEPWDFAKYGSNGTIRDISIYDFDNRLPSGAYQLRVYINGVAQPIGPGPTGQPETWANFEVLPNESISEAGSPDFRWVAVVLGNTRLVLRDVYGTPIDLFTGREITQFAWLPDSQHILFVDRDRSGQQAQTLRGVCDDLWVVDILGHETHLLFKSDVPLGFTGEFNISSDGRYLASSEGSGGGDACFVDLKLIFFEIASDFKSVRTIKQEQFSGIPAAANGSIYPSGSWGWQSADQYVAGMKGTCDIAASLMGSYLFDLSNLTATKE